MMMRSNDTLIRCACHEYLCMCMRVREHLRLFGTQTPTVDPSELWEVTSSRWLAGDLNEVKSYAQICRYKGRTMILCTPVTRKETCAPGFDSQRCRLSTLLVGNTSHKFPLSSTCSAVSTKSLLVSVLFMHPCLNISSVGPPPPPTFLSKSAYRNGSLATGPDETVDKGSYFLKVYRA